MSSNSHVAKLLARNLNHAKTHTPSPIIADVPVEGRAHTLIFCCADGRVDPAAVLGLKLTDAVVIRNAGCGMPRMINDFLILDEVLDLKEVLIISHTDCGLTHVQDVTIRENLKKRALGRDEEIDNLHFGAFTDNFARVISDVQYFRTHPLVRKELFNHTFGAVYDIESGKLTKVDV
ncbi:carbonic anhydrase [Annulohypoxylon bovei var. microspora]|nr:carbonic anhydrase [Annulohypoxylon bovei var. microspora]